MLYTLHPIRRYGLFMDVKTYILFLIISLFKSLGCIGIAISAANNCQMWFQIVVALVSYMHYMFLFFIFWFVNFLHENVLALNDIMENADLIRLMQCFQFWFLCKMPNCTYYSTWTTANSCFEIAFYSSELSNNVFTMFSLFDRNHKWQLFKVSRCAIRENLVIHLNQK